MTHHTTQKLPKIFSIFYKHWSCHEALCWNKLLRLKLNGCDLWGFPMVNYETSFSKQWTILSHLKCTSNVSNKSNQFTLSCLLSLGRLSKLWRKVEGTLFLFIFCIVHMSFRKCIRELFFIEWWLSKQHISSDVRVMHCAAMRSVLCVNDD